MHIGLIGGIGPAATVFYYEQIVAAFAAANRPLHLTIGHTSARMLADNVTAGRAEEQAIEFERVVWQLSAAGAEAVAITSMGGHFCARELEARCSVPLIHGPQAVSAYLERRGIRRVGVLGTRVVMETALYGALRDLEPVAPSGADLTQVNDDYVAVAIAGVALPGESERLLDAGLRLVRDQGAEAVLLGGTDLNLVYADADLEFPVIDSAMAHVEAIVHAAMRPSEHA